MYRKIYDMMIKRFTNDFKRDHSYLATAVFQKVAGTSFKGKEFSIYMVHRWIYGLSKKPIPPLEAALCEVIKETTGREAEESAFTDELIAK